MTKRVRQAVIMVGGKGTRLRPLTDTRPKPILPVLDRPCLAYLIDSMIQGGIEHVILACGYQSDKMVKAIDMESFDARIEYAYEEQPMGTGGAIKLLEDRLDDVFIAANGDVFADISVKSEVDTHINSNSDVTISLTQVQNPCEFGIIRTDKEGRIVEFKEKPKPEEVFSNLINAGIYVINKDVLSYIPKNTPYDFSKDLLPALMSDGRRIQGHEIHGVWRDVGRPSDLIGANQIMAEMRYASNDWSDQVIDSKITGPFYAGPGGTVSSSIMGSSILLSRSSVVSSEATGSLIMKETSVSGSKVVRSIIGEGCKIIDSEIVDSVVADGTTEIRKKIISNNVQ